METFSLFNVLQPLLCKRVLPVPNGDGQDQAVQDGGVLHEGEEVALPPEHLASGRSPHQELGSLDDHTGLPQRDVTEGAPEQRVPHIEALGGRDENHRLCFGSEGVCARAHARERERESATRKVTGNSRDMLLPTYLPQLLLREDNEQ